MGKLRDHLLTDGTTITSKQLAAEMDITIACAMSRLVRSNEREVLFRPPGLTVPSKTGGKGYKIYILSDGSEWTIPQISEKLGVPRSTIAARLHKTKDVKWVLHPKRQCKDDIQQARITRMQSERMIGDGDGFWKIFNSMGKLST